MRSVYFFPSCSQRGHGGEFAQRAARRSGRGFASDAKPHSMTLQAAAEGWRGLGRTAAAERAAHSMQRAARAPAARPWLSARVAARCSLSLYASGRAQQTAQRARARAWLKKGARPQTLLLRLSQRPVRPIRAVCARQSPQQRPSTAGVGHPNRRPPPEASHARAHSSRTRARARAIAAFARARARS